MILDYLFKFLMIKHFLNCISYKAERYSRCRDKKDPVVKEDQEMLLCLVFSDSTVHAEELCNKEPVYIYLAWLALPGISP